MLETKTEAWLWCTREAQLAHPWFLPKRRQITELQVMMTSQRILLVLLSFHDRTPASHIGALLNLEHFLQD